MFRRLAAFDPLSVRELGNGLGGRLGRHLDVDDAYLQVPDKCRPIKLLCALRHIDGAVSVVRDIVAAVQEMAARGSSPNELKAVIENSDLFDQQRCRI